MGEAAVVEVGVGRHLEDGWNLICGTCKPRSLASSLRGETFVQVLLFIPGKHGSEGLLCSWSVEESTDKGKRQGTLEAVVAMGV